MNEVEQLEIGSEFWDIPVTDKDNEIFPVTDNTVTTLWSKVIDFLE